MADKTKTEASDQDAFLMHLDDFLNLIHDEIKTVTGQIHAESLSAFGKLKKAEWELRKTEAAWRKDLQSFLKQSPK